MIAQRVRLVIQQSGLTLPEFSSRTGIKKSTLVNYRDGVYPPTAAFLERVCSEFLINPQWLLLGTGPMKAEQSLSDARLGLETVYADGDIRKKAAAAQCPPGRKATSLTNQDEGEVVLKDPALDLNSQLAESAIDAERYSLIPLLESRVSGGPEGEVLYEEIADYLPFKRDWIERVAGRTEERQRALLLVRVRGDSMSPTINQGEIVLIDTYEGERLHVLDGRIYLVILPDGSSTLKRLVLKKEDGRFKLLCLSDNTPDYRPFEFDLEPGKTLKHYILGRVRWCGKEFD